MKRLQQTPDFDYVLVGGGLQSGLLALALKRHHPNCRLALIERDREIGGNHTWSFHPGDVPEACRTWVEPLIKYRWPGYDVRIGSFSRRVRLPYASVTSEHFARTVGRLFDSAAVTCPERGRRNRNNATQGRLNMNGGAAVAVADPVPCWHLMKSTDVIDVNEKYVVTRCGKLIRGRLVIDCRGPAAQNSPFSGCGFQKFHGFELELDGDWPLKSPVIMESVVDQTDGFRFLYVLPFTPRRVLVEDTRFSDRPDCDRQECVDIVGDYLRRQGVDRFKIIREESGVLPMPFSSDLPPAVASPLSGGYAGGWFHAATGYSFPLAVAFADAVASGRLEEAPDRIRFLSEEHQLRSRYSRFLNRLLFRLVSPRQRHRIFRRFYGVLSDDAVERFYSHRFGVRDALRIVVGIPPTVIGLRPYSFIRSFFRGESQ